MNKTILKLKKWYTLIELLVVMSIMSIILSISWIVITSFISYQRDSNNAYLLYQSVKDVQTNVSNSKYYAGQVKFQIWQPSISPVEISYFLNKDDMSSPIPPFIKHEEFSDTNISIWKIIVKTLATYSTRSVSSVIVVYEGTNMRLYDDFKTELESVEMFIYDKNKATNFVVKMNKYYILPTIEKWN